jgi:protein TonB
MSTGSHQRVDVVARDRGEAGHDAAAPGPLRRAPIITVTNVIPFTRLRRDGVVTEPASELPVDSSQRPAPYWPAPNRRGLFMLLFALSLLTHGGLYALFNREPEPMASIGLEAISVEIVLGAHAPAGLAPSPGENETQAAPPDDPKQTEDMDAKPDPAAETPVQTAQPDPQERPENPEPPTAAEPSPEPEKVETAALQIEPAPPPREPDMTVAPEQPAVEPAKPETVQPVKHEPKPVQEHVTRPKQDHQAKPKQQRPQKRTASTEPHATGPRANAAGGVGAGRSQSDSNYNGMVSAHLQRHKRYPADARSRGDQGTAAVSFALDGSGRVTRVGLARGTGFASLDQEVQAMVRRASPFPAPPDGRSRSFTVPVSFRFQ